MSWERRERGRSGVGLTPRQARFVDEYLIDLNATQAAIRAGYSAKTAQPQSSRLLSKVIVRAAIVDGKTERHTESVMSAVEALERASTIGRLDIRQFYRDDQSLKDVSEWTPAMGAQVARIETIVINAAAGDRHTDTVHKLGFHDDLKGLEFIGRHHGVFAAEKANVQFTADAAAVKILQAAYARAKPVRKLKA